MKLIQTNLIHKCFFNNKLTFSLLWVFFTYTCSAHFSFKYIYNSTHWIKMYMFLYYMNMIRAHGSCPFFYLNFNVNRIYGYIKINVKTGLAPVDEAAKSLHTVPPHCKN